MAFGNASAERAAIELTYEDTATVSRTTSQRGKNNISTSSTSVIYDGIICALSYSHTLKSNYQTNTDAKSEYYYGLAVGDKVVLLRNAGGQAFLVLGRV